MSSIVGFLRRNWQASSPPEPRKNTNAIKFGILGAANIAATTFITPAKSHPDVEIHAVAARQKEKALAYAKKHNIPHVLDSYQAILDDCSIDAVYIPLVTSLHYEWAVKAIAKGKHVLIEKPATVNSADAEMLFRSPMLRQPNAPVLLEAMHFRFQPSWLYFLSLIDRQNIQTIDSYASLPSYVIPKGNAQLEYDLSGGTMLHLGTYPMYAMRQIRGDEPEECGRVGSATINARASVTTFPTFNILVSHKEVKAEDMSLPKGQTKWKRRNLSFSNLLISSFWHRIDIVDEYTIQHDTNEKDLKEWTVKQSKKVYTFKDAGIDQPSEPSWSSYRQLLEQFVNYVHGNKGSGFWVDHEDSIAQARMIDMAYEKSGLPIRPTSNFRPQESMNTLLG
ncbi:oxidoreductase domain-containing protein [Fusarium pseudoanthophilum]|uniref:D-xylose 1-dehydrogenase (NADP(+), D-xylono-1,5-lactone-forming) n=1 Tax=Fusarium pseudoanthophilum TaxID=48495 RepID=A0A8H5P5W7_9HYPO|nr:oxidoreductase domain-containing protein [Fusarium pseudoanthophilum]